MAILPCTILFVKMAHDKNLAWQNLAWRSDAAYNWQIGSPGNAPTHPPTSNPRTSALQVVLEEHSGQPCASVTA